MNKLTVNLNNKFKAFSQSILHGRKHLKPELDSLFDKLCINLHISENSLISFINCKSDQRKNGWIKEVESTNFKITYIVYNNLESELFINYIESQSIKLQSNFIENNSLTNQIKYVYFIKSEYGYKIGKTKDIKKRLNTFGVKLPFDFNLHSYIETKKMDECELFFHDVFNDRRINGEWFNLNNDDFITIEILSKKFGKYIVLQSIDYQY